MENTLEINQLNQDVPASVEMDAEEYEALLDAQIAIEFAKLDKKKEEIKMAIQQANQKINQAQSIKSEEKEIEMNAVNNVVETVAPVGTTTPAVVENNTRVVAKKVATILGKVIAGAVVGGGLVVVGAHNHKKVNKAVKQARKRVGKVIPALAPKPWWKF